MSEARKIQVHFQNELGHGIHIVVERAEDDTVKYSMLGPESALTGEMTLMEATQFGRTLALRIIERRRARRDAPVGRTVEANRAADTPSDPAAEAAHKIEKKRAKAEVKRLKKQKAEPRDPERSA